MSAAIAEQQDLAAFTAEQFERCWPWLAEAVALYGPTHDKAHVWAAIEAGEAQLWPSPNAAMVTLIRVSPTGFKELVAWLAGGAIEEIQAWEPLIVRFAREQGCGRMSIVGRRGWLRSLPGYREIATVMGKELGA